MESVGAFVGIPYKHDGYGPGGLNCWGLALQVLNRVYGVALRDHEGAAVFNDALSDVIDSETVSPKWKQVQTPREGDVVIMLSRPSGRPDHIGVYIGGRDVIHAHGRDVSGCSKITPIGTLERCFKSLEFYRYDPTVNNSS